jgi:hypothetical protein
MYTSMLPICSTASGDLFLMIKIVKVIETVELLGSVATIFKSILTSEEFYVP